jgi:hypothetical protein
MMKTWRRLFFKNRKIGRCPCGPLTIGRQQLKILLIRRVPSSFKYNLKANGVRTISFWVIELKKSSSGKRHVAELRPGDDFGIGRLFFYTKHRPILKAPGRTSHRSRPAPE